MEGRFLAGVDLDPAVLLDHRIEGGLEGNVRE